MSKTKQGGSSRLGRDSMSQRLGIKAHDGQAVRTGMVLIRQRGSKYLAGKNVKIGSDDTIYSMADGKVSFSTKNKKLYDGSSREVRVISVEPAKK